jgi:hypothetical protein
MRGRSLCRVLVASSAVIACNAILGNEDILYVDRVDAGNGAVPEAGARPVVVSPSGALASVPIDDAQAISTLASVELDTDNGEISGGMRAPGPNVVDGIGYYDISQEGGSNVGVFTFRSLTIPAGATVRMKGTKPGAILVRETLVFEGTLSVTADCAANVGVAGGGAGGATSTGSVAADGGGPNGGAGGTQDRGRACAGGGGGNATPGGSGGAVLAGVPCPAPPGGGKAPDLLATAVLTAGSGGGAGVALGLPVANGGAGGGAVSMFVSGELVVRGIIDARGCGGKGPLWSSASVNRSAGGGGSGGSIQIEAARLTIASTARIVANGGGGGGTYCGNVTNRVTEDLSGQDGQLSADVAKGGPSHVDDAGTKCPGGGGNGGAGPTAASGGTSLPSALQDQATGGGGGAAGQIVLRTREVKVTIEQGAIVSPTAQTGPIGVRP